MATLDTSPAGLLLSLASTLPTSSPLARRARRVAGQLAHGASSRAVARRALDLTADLLASDPLEGSGYAGDLLLDPEWDA